MGNSSQHQIDYSEIPADFPRSAAFLTLPRGRDNRLYSFYQGKFYPPGGSPPEIWTSWQICEELVQHFKLECVAARNRSPLLPAAEILQFYFEDTLEKGWGTEAEIRWIFRHVARRLGWPAPAEP